MGGSVCEQVLLPQTETPNHFGNGSCCRNRDDVHTCAKCFAFASRHGLRPLTARGAWSHHACRAPYLLLGNALLLPQYSSQSSSDCRASASQSQIVTT